jgi:hypothetical protein
MLLLAIAAPSVCVAHPWHRIQVSSPGPYVDVIAAYGGLWISSSSVKGFVWVPASGPSKVFASPGFRPAYLTLGQDGRIWATDVHRPDTLGAVTPQGQVTLYKLSGVAKIPASKLTALGNYGLMYVGATSEVVSIFDGAGGGEPYPSALTDNRDIGMTTVPGLIVWFTECCWPFGGAIGVRTAYSGTVEVPLPYPECEAPAGIAWAANLKLYIACSGKRDTLLVVYDQGNGKQRTLTFPGRYLSRVNSEAGGSDGNVYFAPGIGPGLVVYDVKERAFSTIPTPDNSSATIVTSGTRDLANALYVVAGAGSTLYKYDVR